MSDDEFAAALREALMRCRHHPRIWQGASTLLAAGMPGATVYAVESDPAGGDDR